MSTGASVHVTETLDVAQAKCIHDLAKVAKDGLQELYSRCSVLGSSGVDVVMHVGSLGAYSIFHAAHSTLSYQPAAGVTLTL